MCGLGCSVAVQTFESFCSLRWTVQVFMSQLAWWRQVMMNRAAKPELGNYNLTILRSLKTSAVAWFQHVRTSHTVGLPASLLEIETGYI